MRRPPRSPLFPYTTLFRSTTRLSGLRNGQSSAGKQPARRMPYCPTTSAECHYTLRASLVEHPFRMHQLGIQYGGAGRATDGVVAEHDEFVIENMAGAQAPHESGHAALALGVFARLRAVGLVPRSEEHTSEL